MKTSIRATLQTLFFGTVCMVLPHIALAGGDAENGKALSQTCAACHAADGNSTLDANPKLAGQYESYLVQALKSYRDGSRSNPIMAGFAAPLSDQDIRDLAAYYASQSGELKTASP